MLNFKSLSFAEKIGKQTAENAMTLLMSVLAIIAILMLFHNHLEVGVAVLVALIGLYQYSDNKKREIRVSEFSQYNELITTLIQGKNGCETYVDLQVAAVYQLKYYYKSYYPLTEKILTNLDESWSTKEKKASYSPRLKLIIDETLIHIGKSTEVSEEAQKGAE